MFQRFISAYNLSVNRVKNLTRRSRVDQHSKTCEIDSTGQS